MRISFSFTCFSSFFVFLQSDDSRAISVTFFEFELADPAVDFSDSVY